MNYWETPEYRDKYNDKEKKASLAKGHALANANGDPSYPIEDAEDLDHAIQAVGRGGSDHDAIRKHIMDQAKRLGLSSKIPDNWNADGSMKQSNSAKKPHHRSGLPVLAEFRHVASNLEVRTSVDDSSGDLVQITGAPIVYNAPYSVLDAYGEFEERMHPGVANDVLAKQADVRFLFDHTGLPLARTASGTLTLNDGTNELRFVANLDLRQQLANDLIIAIQRGDISQMSCGFVVGQDEWNSDYSKREVYRFQQLLDVSAVTYPASPTTSIEIAQRMMLGMPVESRARTRKIWQISKELRDGQVSPDKAAALSSALEALHRADSALATVSGAHDEMGNHIGNAIGFDSDPDNSNAGSEQDPMAEMDASGTRSEEQPAKEERTEGRPAKEEKPAKPGLRTSSLKLQLEVLRQNKKKAA